MARARIKHYTSRAYSAIQAFYGERTAARSGVPLIKHIDEGIIILDRIGADPVAKDAFCIHPLVQADDDLSANWVEACIAAGDACVMMLAIEYRHIANAFLSDKIRKQPGMLDLEYECVSLAPLNLSPLQHVNDMLIADKVQNRKDFERYHKGTHQRSDELDYYFRLWINKLGITEKKYNELIEGI